MRRRIRLVASTLRRPPSKNSAVGGGAAHRYSEGFSGAAVHGVCGTRKRFSRGESQPYDGVGRGSGPEHARGAAWRWTPARKKAAQTTLARGRGRRAAAAGFRRRAAQQPALSPRQAAGGPEGGGRRVHLLGSGGVRACRRRGGGEPRGHGGASRRRLVPLRRCCCRRRAWLRQLHAQGARRRTRWGARRAGAARPLRWCRAICFISGAPTAARTLSHDSFVVRGQARRG